jgi:NADH-quinone oxidoreductase subunit M
MVNHGLSSAGLFAIVGMIYDRYHTRQISELGGLAKRTPILATFAVLFTMSSVGLPGMNGFVGEFFILAGMFQRAWVDAPGLLGPQLLVIAVLAVSGVVLGAWYMLWMVQRVFFGPLKEPHASDSHGHAHEIRDLQWQEIAALAPLLLFIVWIGVYPLFFLKPISPAVTAILDHTDAPLKAYYAADAGVRGQESGGSSQELGVSHQFVTPSPVHPFTRSSDPPHSPLPIPHSTLPAALSATP